MSTSHEPADTRSLTSLPEAVRGKLLEWAAEALGAAQPAEIPTALRRFARFAPAKRAKLAAHALTQSLQNDAAFRTMVAARAAQLPGGSADEGAGDPTTAAARAFLLRLPGQDDLLAAAATAAQEAGDRGRVVELEREVRALSTKLERTAAELAALSQVNRPGQPDPESARLKLRLREQGNRFRELQQQFDGERARSSTELAAAVAARDEARAEVEVLQQRLAAADARADAAALNVQRLRESAGDRRATSDRRLELLLGTLEGAASGLRREWDLVGGGQSPADVVADRLPRPPIDAERTSDPSRLASWIALPGAHLIVDGYNVTKTGYPALPLSEQRDRLIRSLAAFAARTSAEVTVVFDGAAVATARPAGRGIRVLFSPAGVTADHVIRDLVRAEPLGRVLIVVSSDREVVDRASVDGARTAPSAVLVTVLGG